MDITAELNRIATELRTSSVESDFRSMVRDARSIERLLTRYEKRFEGPAGQDFFTVRRLAHDLKNGLENLVGHLEEEPPEDEWGDVDRGTHRDRHYWSR